MKKLYTTLLLVCSMFLTKGQVTLTTTDLTHSGDQYVVSNGVAFSGMDPTLTGPNYVWDYSMLTSSSQTIDTIFDESATGSLLSLYFIDNAFNPNRSNQAHHGNSFAVGQVNVSDVWDFFYNTSSSFNQPGFGAIVNGAPLPIAFNQKDYIYNFPLTYNSSNVSPTGYTIDLTTTLGIYYSVRKERSNITDGWGSVTTPYGTFDALRVKSTIVEVDSFYVDSLGFGFATPAITTTEYKWLSPGKGIPVLQINTSVGGIVSQITYRDTLQSTGIAYQNQNISGLVVFPNPTAKELFLKYTVATNDPLAIEIYSTAGQLVGRESVGENIAGEIKIQRIDLEKYNLKSGNYMLKLSDSKSILAQKEFSVQ